MLTASDNLYDLLSAYVEAKIAAISAGLLVLTIWQSHHCSALEKGQLDWPEVKVINEEQQVTKVWCKLRKRLPKAAPSYSTCSPAQMAMLNAGLRLLFDSFSMIDHDEILTENFQTKQ